MTTKHSKTLNNIFIALSLFIISACNVKSEKTSFDSHVHIYIDSTQKVLNTDDLVTLFNNDKSAYVKNFNDSSIFITGDIQRIDNEHGEVLLRNSYENNVVVLLKDSTILPLLTRSDKVLLKGTCKAGMNTGVILIINCELVNYK